MAVRQDWDTIVDDLTAQINGLIDTFTTSERFRPGTLRARLNGIEVEPGEAFLEISENTFQFLPFILRVPDQLIMRYIPY